MGGSSGPERSNTVDAPAPSFGSAAGTTPAHPVAQDTKSPAATVPVSVSDWPAAATASEGVTPATLLALV